MASKYVYKGGKKLANSGSFKAGTKVRVGKKHSEIAKAKMSKAHKKMSPETRKKMSAAKIGKTGSLAANWRGGLTPVSTQVRNHYKMREWRSDVFTKDSFSCVLCGDNRGGNLNADHIFPFSRIMREYKISSIEEAIACEKLWDINNGRTLCVSCHRKTDTFGSKAKHF